MGFQGDVSSSQGDTLPPQGDAFAAQGDASAHKATETLLDTVTGVTRPLGNGAWTIRNARWSNALAQAKNKP
jgi:hypothetical protein